MNNFSQTAERAAAESNLHNTHINKAIFALGQLNQFATYCARQESKAK
jgi:hypothetical protein